MYHLQVILSYTAQTNRRAGEKVRGIALLRCPRAVLSFFQLPLDITQLLLQDSPAYISEFDPRCRHTGRLERRVFASDCCQGSHWCILAMKTICSIYRHNRIAPLGDNISTALSLNDLKGLPALFTGVSCLFFTVLCWFAVTPTPFKETIAQCEAAFLPLCANQRAANVGFVIPLKLKSLFFVIN